LRRFADAPIILLHNRFELFRGDFGKALQERSDKANPRRKLTAEEKGDHLNLKL